jgi:hypothetical protein
MDTNIVSALIGAIIGGIFTSATTWWSIRRSQKNQIAGVVQGIRAEVETLWDIYRIKFKDAIPLLENGEPILKEYPLYLYQGYFVVYDSNSSRIGQIADDILRKEIVTGYLKAKELIDAHLHNNKLVEDLDNWKRLYEENHEDKYDKQIEITVKKLGAHAKYLKEIYEDVRERQKKLVQLLDLYPSKKLNDSPSGIEGASDNSLQVSAE